jgi:flagellar hook assembly protein FlgD
MLWVLSAGSDEFVLEGMGSIILSGSVTDMTLSKVAEIPETFGLSQNFPNPFNPVTNISFQVPQASDVTVSVYNMMGQKVADLVEGHIDAGFHQVVWDSRNLQGESVSSGVYLYTISSGNFHTMKKMILMK